MAAAIPRPHFKSKLMKVNSTKIDEKKINETATSKYREMLNRHCAEPSPKTPKSILICSFFFGHVNFFLNLHPRLLHLRFIQWPSVDVHQQKRQGLQGLKRRKKRERKRVIE